MTREGNPRLKVHLAPVALQIPLRWIMRGLAAGKLVEEVEKVVG